MAGQVTARFDRGIFRRFGMSECVQGKSKCTLFQSTGWHQVRHGDITDLAFRVSAVQQVNGFSGRQSKRAERTDGAVGAITAILLEAAGVES